MRKMVYGRQFSRAKKAREALFRSLIRALVVGGKLTTTKAKAKAIQGQVDKLVTLAKKQTIASRRQALAYLANDKETTGVLFERVAKSVGGRVSGFTRIITLPQRSGDKAEMAKLEWVDQIVTAKPEKKTEEGKKVKSKVKVNKKTVKEKTK